MTAADIIWGKFRPGFFDPVPLDQLAAHMRDGKWLSLQTENGLLERVRIIEIRVYVQSEDIVLRQEWIDEREEFQHRQLVIESESIWKAWPIKMSVNDVKPPVQTRAADVDQVFGVILSVLVAETSFTTGDLTAGGTRGKQAQPLADARQSGIVLLYEMTDLEPLDACQRFGYRSPQPLHTARWKMDTNRAHPTGSAAEFRKATKHRAREVWTRLGYPARRTVRDGRKPLI